MTASDFIKEFSAKTWSDIRFARNKKGIIRLGEVTLTQNLILSIAYQYHNFPKYVYLFEAINEKANGNDIELFIRNGMGKLIAYPCQAKIVDKTPNEIYSQINHSNKSSHLQINALLKYSRELGGFPLYLLYNYSKAALFQQKLLKEVADSYGCSYVPASYLKHRYCPSSVWQKPLPSFKDLHPLIGKPFYRLFELGSKSLKEIVVELTGFDADPSKLIDWPIREYTLDELHSDKAWEAINYFQDLADIGKVFNRDDRIRDQNNSNEESNVFSPKYRLVFIET